MKTRERRASLRELLPDDPAHRPMRCDDRRAPVGAPESQLLSDRAQGASGEGTLEVALRPDPWLAAVAELDWGRAARPADPASGGGEGVDRGRNGGQGGHALTGAPGGGDEWAALHRGELGQLGGSVLVGKRGARARPGEADRPGEEPPPGRAEHRRAERPRRRPVARRSSVSEFSIAAAVSLVLAAGGAADLAEANGAGREASKNSPRRTEKLARKDEDHA